MSDQTNRTECVALEVSFLTRLRDRERELRVGDLLAKLRQSQSDQRMAEVDEKVRQAVEHGKRVNAKVEALIVEMRRRLEREDAGGSPSSS